jgi:hypothetical protein
MLIKGAQTAFILFSTFLDLRPVWAASDLQISINGRLEIRISKSKTPVRAALLCRESRHLGINKCYFLTALYTRRGVPLGGRTSATSRSVSTASRLLRWLNRMYSCSAFIRPSVAIQMVIQKLPCSLLKVRLVE